MQTLIFITALFALIGLVAAGPAGLRQGDIVPTTLIDPVITATPEFALTAGHGNMKALYLFTLRVLHNSEVDLTTTRKVNVYPATKPVTIPPEGGLPGNSNMPADGTATMLPSTYCGGNIQIDKADWNYKNADLPIELSYHLQPREEFAGFSVDVAYVDGFTFPVDCFCTSSGGARLERCKTNFWAVSSCPGDLLISGQGSCKNPLKVNDGLSLTPHPFYAPCHGEPYT